MSSDIWTPCGAMNNVKPLAGEAYRVAEDQSRKALRGLVDSDAEHDLVVERKRRLDPNPVPECKRQTTNWKMKTEV